MPKRADGPEAGFTLTETLVALVVTGLVAAGVVGLLMEQNRFYHQHDEIVYAEQTVRGVSDLVSRELREAAQRDVLYAGPDSVQIVSDRYRGMVCRVSGSEVSYYVYDDPSAHLSGRTGTAYMNPTDDAFDHDYDWDGFGREATTSERDACVDNGTPPVGTAGTAASDYRTVDFAGADDFSGPAPVTGALVRVYARLAYHFEPSSFTAGLALMRNGQELVAPFADGAGFAYVTKNDGLQSTLGAKPWKDNKVIKRIRVNATATGGGDERFDVSRDMSYDLALRN